MPSNGKPSNGRFELPALAPINFNLTDGTNIPPPPDSPIEEKPPPPPASKPTAPPITTQTDAPSDGRGGQNDGTPQSPASTTRPSSIRRFLSRKSLNANYTNGTNHNESLEDLNARPDSPSSFVDGRPGLKKTKSGSWFRRLGGNNRSSVIYETEKKSQVPQKKGPPPPKLPELNQLKAKVHDNDEGSLGADDMFKNIK